MTGVRIIRATERTTATAQTANMRREAAIEPEEGAPALSSGWAS